MADRREGRRGRLGEAEPLVPVLVWLALFLGGALVITYMCFYADPAESAVVQGMMIGAVTAMVVAGILVVWFLERPYENATGSIEPTAMTMTLERMEAESSASGTRARRLCDERGQS
jgi:vacuolar-type H+-ATPase subunit I/STV1